MDRKFRQHLAESNKTAAERMGLYPSLNGFCLEFNYPLGNKYALMAIENFEKDPLSNRLWLNQLETAIDAIAACVKNPDKAALIIGSTQLGKTMTLICCSLLEIFLSLKYNKLYRAAILSPSKVSIDTQTIADVKLFNWLYSNLKITFKKKSTILHEHQAKVARGFENEESYIPQFRRSKGEEENKLRQFQENIKKVNGNCIWLIDESHWGESVGSVLHRMLEEHWCNTGDVMVSISATPFPIAGLDNIHLIRHRITTKYVGYAFWNGKLLDDRFPLRMPHHVSFQSQRMQDEFNLFDFDLVNKAFYRDENQFNKHLEKIEDKLEKNKISFDRAHRWLQFDSWKNYRDFVENKLVEFIKSTAKHGKGRGTALRFFIRNEDAKAFTEKHTKNLGNIKCFFWGGKNSAEELSDVINNETKPGQKYAILLTANGRMGNRFPNDCVYFAEFSQDGNLTALLQSIGRITGYRDILPYVFLHEDRLDELEHWIYTLGIPKKRPHPNTDIIGAKQETQSVTLDREFFNIHAPKTGQQLDVYISKRLEEKTTIQGRRSKNVDDFWTIITPDVFNLIENVLEFPPGTLLRYTENKANLCEPYLDDHGYGYHHYVGLRTVDSTSTKNSNLLDDTKSDRLVSGTRKDIWKIQVQLHVRHNGKRAGRGNKQNWSWVKIRLRAISLIVANSRKVQVKPNTKSLTLEMFGTAQEKIDAYTRKG